MEFKSRAAHVGNVVSVHNELYRSAGNDTFGANSSAYGILAHVANPAGKKVLDVGCGDGGLLAVLADAGMRTVGIDMSKVGIDKARELFANKPQAVFLVGDILERGDELTERFGPFDVVNSRLVLQHIATQDKEAFTRMLANLTAQDGILALTFFRAVGEERKDFESDKLIPLLLKLGFVVVEETSESQVPLAAGGFADKVSLILRKNSRGVEQLTSQLRE